MYNASSRMVAGYPRLTASVSPGSVSGTRSDAGTTTTGSTTASPIGGAAGITYSWACTGGITVTSPTSASTTFSKSLTNGGSASGTATCTLTDSQGQTTTVTVSVSLTSTFVSHLSVSVTPGSASSAGGGPGTGPYTQGFGVSISGGSGTYNYNWVIYNLNGANASFTTGTSGATVGVTWDNPNPIGTSFSEVYCYLYDVNTGDSTYNYAVINTH